MRRLPGAIGFFLLAMALPLSARAQAFRALSFLDPNDANRYSQAFGVSGDGKAVGGESNLQAFRWKVIAPATLQPLGFLPGGSTSSARGVSVDGSVVVGWSSFSGGSRAFRWTQPTGMVNLGILGGTYSSAEDCSADGSVVIGTSASSAGNRGFRWTEAGGMVELPSLPFPGKDTSAHAVSADGNAAVGRSGCCANTGAVMAVRWTQSGGFAAEGLGDLSGTPPESPWGAASGISADAQVIVGGGGAPSLAFRWVSGIMSALTPTSFPPPNAPVSAMDASGDGSIIVGAAATSSGDPASTPVGPIPGARAFIWSAADGIRDLKQVLSNLGLASALQGWTLEIATAISDDGNIIAGYGTHNGKREGWVAALSGTPFPSSEPDGGPPAAPGKFLAILSAGVRESHGFLWHPTKGPQPIAPDPPPFAIAELLSFTLSPRVRSQRVEMLAFSLESPEGIARNAWSDLALIVDQNANGTIDPAERTTESGRGFADPNGRLVFLQPFTVAAPTHYVLRAQIAGVRTNSRVTVALRESLVVVVGSAAEGSVVRHLTVERATAASRLLWVWVLIAVALLVILVRAIALIRHRAPGR